jgi:hypothetical protein
LSVCFAFSSSFRTAAAVGVVRLPLWPDLFGLVVLSLRPLHAERSEGLKAGMKAG